MTASDKSLSSRDSAEATAARAGAAHTSRRTTSVLSPNAPRAPASPPSCCVGFITIRRHKELLMHSKALAIVCAAAAAVCAALPAKAQDDDKRTGTGLLASAPLSARLAANGQTRTFDGRLNAELSFDEASIKAGELRALHFNVALLGVDQYAITGRVPKGPAMGALGVVIAPGSKASLRYDDGGREARGELEVRLAIPQFEELFGFEQPRDQKEDDLFTSTTQAGKLNLALSFDQPLSRALGSVSEKRFAKLSAKLSAEPIRDASGATLLKGYVLEFEVANVQIDVFERIQFEVAKNLCLQPVRFRNSGWFDFFPTGLGLAFGMPGAKKEWGKADVTFTVREWMTITNGALKVATAAEEPTILASVNVDDCIEVFFVENFSPESSHGGGATWSSGTASAKVISSDGNATFGVDLTHLAHELGHVLNMGHPGSPSGLYNASTNTLMCPSGWHNDNPKRNSTANKNNVSNPLLTFSLKAIGPAPDCANSATCGACP
jgi:hypothetical protein